MQKIHFSITINAKKEKVWDTMLSDTTYRQWTEAFSKGSFFEGSWSQGSEIKFLSPNEEGKMRGMVSRIKEIRPYEFVSIEHLCFINDGEKDTTSDDAKAFAGALENYTFKEADGKTELFVDMDTADEYKAMFEEMWPKALQKLKEITE